MSNPFFTGSLISLIFLNLADIGITLYSYQNCPTFQELNPILNIFSVDIITFATALIAFKVLFIVYILFVSKKLKTEIYTDVANISYIILFGAMFYINQ